MHCVGPTPIAVNALNAPRLMRDVYDGKRFKDGIAVRTMIEPTRAALIFWLFRKSSG